MTYTQESLGFASDVDMASHALPAIDVYDRLAVVKDTAGFLPTTRGELTEAMSLLSFQEVPGGAAAHLNEILLHQKRSASVDPQAAVRSVTNQYAGYARKARYDLTALTTLREELEESTGNPLTSVKEAGAVTGLGQLARYKDITSLAGARDPDKFPFPPLYNGADNKRNAFDPYTAAQPDPLARERIVTVARAERLWHGRALVRGAIEDQQARFSFWVDRLQEARQHGAAKPVAAVALQNLGVKVD